VIGAEESPARHPEGLERQAEEGEAEGPGQEGAAAWAKEGEEGSQAIDEEGPGSEGGDEGAGGGKELAQGSDGVARQGKEEEDPTKGV
jgi:hypothetical protein